MVNEPIAPRLSPPALSAAEAALSAAEESAGASFPLGTAIAQLHGIYILAQTTEGLILVDAHAAHERVLYERLKRDFEAEPAVQHLLTPEIVEIALHETDIFLAQQPDFLRAGFEIDVLAPGRLAVRSVPALLATTPAAPLLREVLSAIQAEEGSHHLDAAAHRLLGNLACRSAIHGGRRLSLPEMNALLRDMEATDRAGHCNHGRPTWALITLEQLDRLFLRGR